MRRAVRGAGRGGALRARPRGSCRCGGRDPEGPLGWGGASEREAGRGGGQGLYRAVMRVRRLGRRPSVRWSGGGVKDMKVSGCGGTGGERPQVWGAGLAEAPGRGRGTGGAGGRVRWEHRFAGGRVLRGEAEAAGEPRPGGTTGARGGAREALRAQGAGPRLVCRSGSGASGEERAEVSGRWRRERRPLRCFGVWVEAGVLGSLRILETSRVAAGPKGLPGLPVPLLSWTWESQLSRLLGRQLPLCHAAP